MDLIPVGIVGLGGYVPDRVLTNQDLEQMVDTSDEWIRTRTGIRERRMCAEDQATSDLATEAARRAIDDAGLTVEDIDLIICCTFTPDHFCPATSCLVQYKLGMKKPAGAMDLAAACSGFIYGCSVGANFIRTGTYKHVLVIGAEAMTRFMDYQDRNTCVIFGDGAGAVVLGPVEPGQGMLGQCMGADGSGSDLIIMPAGGAREPITEEGVRNRRHYMRMSGNEVFKFATRICGQAVREALADTGSELTPEDLDLIVPHQANIRIIESAAKKLGVPVERFVVNIDKYGNTSAATVPLAMVDARAEGRMGPGSLIAMVAFGGGLTYAASIWRM